MSMSHGPGQPLYARCSQCRKKESGRRASTSHAVHSAGRIDRMRLTSRTRYRPNSNGGRVDVLYQYEYRCLDCGHVGWTRHIDVARKWIKENEIAANELGIHH